MRPFLALFPLALLAACGGVPVPAPDLPAGRSVDDGGFETYTTQHNGFSRVRRSHATDADSATLAAFEDADPSDPAGYRSLIDLAGTPFDGRMNIEVLAEVDGPDGPATRLIRLTVDEQPFNNLQDGALIAATGQFFLRGGNAAWVTVDDGPLLQGSDANGLVNMVIDFDTETVSMNLRTGVAGESQVRLEITAEEVPLNIRTGAYGDDITIQVWDPDGPDVLSVDGTLRGSLGGTPDYTDGISDLSTSGLYSADGFDPATGRRLRVDGVFYGVDPNALADQ